MRAESEVRRQIGELEKGGVIEQATRGFDEGTNETFHLRGKADAPDYRYMPDPELGAIVVDQVCLLIYYANAGLCTKLLSV